MDRTVIRGDCDDLIETSSLDCVKAAKGKFMLCKSVLEGNSSGKAWD